MASRRASKEPMPLCSFLAAEGTLAAAAAAAALRFFCAEPGGFPASLITARL